MPFVFLKDLICNFSRRFLLPARLHMAQKFAGSADFLGFSPSLNFRFINFIDWIEFAMEGGFKLIILLF